MPATQSKERILVGAKELFLSRGYAAMTVDAICREGRADQSPRCRAGLEGRMNRAPQF